MVHACTGGTGSVDVQRIIEAADGVQFLVEELLASPGVPQTFAETVQRRLEPLTPPARCLRARRRSDVILTGTCSRRRRDSTILRWPKRSSKRWVPSSWKSMVTGFTFDIRPHAKRCSIPCSHRAGPRLRPPRSPRSTQPTLSCGVRTARPRRLPNGLSSPNVPAPSFMPSASTRWPTARWPGLPPR